MLGYGGKARFWPCHHTDSFALRLPQSCCSSSSESSWSSVREARSLTTFYPLVFTSQNLHTLLRSGDLDPNKPLLLLAVARATRADYGFVHFHLAGLTRRSDWWHGSLQLVFNIAPAGTTPCSKYCHRPITSLRATATIATRRMRLF